VLRAVLSQADVSVGGDAVEVSRRRSITLSPSGRATTILNQKARPATADGARSVAGVAA
jgi:hypothetical protein